MREWSRYSASVVGGRVSRFVGRGFRMDHLEIRVHEPNDAVAGELIAELDAELRMHYSEDDIHGLTPEEMQDFPGTFFVTWLAGQPVACGGLRPLEDGMAELKRMFVRRSVRGQGLGRRLLEELEQQARQSGARVIRLETGEFQVEAVGLYESTGYRRIPCFGEYAGSAISICYQKTLDRGDHETT